MSLSGLPSIASFRVENTDPESVFCGFGVVRHWPLCHFSSAGDHCQRIFFFLPLVVSCAFVLFVELMVIYIW